MLCLETRVKTQECLECLAGRAGAGWGCVQLEWGCHAARTRRERGPKPPEATAMNDFALRGRAAYGVKVG